MFRHSIPARLYILAALCILSTSASTTVQLILETDAKYTHGTNGSTSADSNASTGGAIFSIVAAPTTSGLDVTSAVAVSEPNLFALFTVGALTESTPPAYCPCSSIRTIPGLSMQAQVQHCCEVWMEEPIGTHYRRCRVREPSRR